MISSNTAISVLVAVLGVSTVIGGLLSVRKSAETPVKVMWFVGYFWLTAFIQLLLIACAYVVWQHLS